MTTHALLKTPKRRRKFPLEHVDRCSALLIAMVPYAQLIKTLSQEWHKPVKYVKDLVVHIHEDWAGTAALVTETRKHQVRQAFEALYMKAGTAKDHNAQARILREIGLLDGCYQAQKVDHTINGHLGVGVGISLGSLGFNNPEEVAARIEHLRGMLASQGPKALQGALPAAVSQAILSGQQVPSNVPSTYDHDQEPDDPVIIDVPPSDPEGEPS